MIKTGTLSENTWRFRPSHSQTEILSRICGLQATQQSDSQSPTTSIDTVATLLTRGVLGYSYGSRASRRFGKHIPQKRQLISFVRDTTTSVSTRYGDWIGVGNQALLPSLLLFCLSSCCKLGLGSPCFDVSCGMPFYGLEKGSEALKFFFGVWTHLFITALCSCRVGPYCALDLIFYSQRVWSGL